MAVFLPQRRHRRLQMQLRAVADGSFDERQRQLPRRDHARRRRPQGTADRFGKIRLHGAHLVAGEELHPRHAVFHAARVECLQGFQLRLTERQNVAAGLPERHVQPSAKLRHQPVPLHIQPRHVRAGMGVVARVDDGGIGLAGTVCNVVALFQHRHGQLVARQLVSARRTDDAAADDDDIVHNFHLKP